MYRFVDKSKAIMSKNLETVREPAKNHDSCIACTSYTVICSLFKKNTLLAANLEPPPQNTLLAIRVTVASARRPRGNVIF